MIDLLSHNLIGTAPHGRLTLPGVLAALARDEVDSFPALRAHQGMFWHMFLVQLGALALHRADRTDIAKEEDDWHRLLRGLTPGFSGDEPWCLAVDDWSKPAFMQPPVPADVKLTNTVATPDALDLLITSKNHDLKQNVGKLADAEEWLFALVSLQTGEGYGGKGNQGIARMNGGSSSRPMLALAPLLSPDAKAMSPRPGAWFSRDVRILLETREKQRILDFPESGGQGLIWLAPWPEDDQLQTRALDQWFIEICRRIRLCAVDGRIEGRKGTSKATRIDAKHLKGNLGDPWAPIEKTEGKNFTLGDAGDFSYGKLIELLFSGEWALPLLARPAPFETSGTPHVLVAQALARGNSKTGGFKLRAVPIHGKALQTFWSEDQRKAVHELAKAQAEEIAVFDKALSYALVLAAAGGETAKIKRGLYAFVSQARDGLDRFADSIFFEHLWQRFEVVDHDTHGRLKREFVARLWQRTQAIFDQALPAMPCSSLFRPRAEARARAALRGLVMKSFQSYLKPGAQDEEMTDNAA